MLKPVGFHTYTPSPYPDCININVLTHEKELAEHKAAKEAFNKVSGRIPTIKELTAEYEKVLSQKQRNFAEYRDNRSAMRELLTVKANVDIVTGRQTPQKGKKENQHAL